MPYTFYLYDAAGELIAPLSAVLASDAASRAQAGAYLATHRTCEEVEIWQARRYVGQGRRSYASAAATTASISFF